MIHIETKPSARPHPHHPQVTASLIVHNSSQKLFFLVYSVYEGGHEWKTAFLISLSVTFILSDQVGFLPCIHVGCEIGKEGLFTLLVFKGEFGTQL